MTIAACKTPTFALSTPPTSDNLRRLVRRLAIELHFQPSEIDRLTVAEACWYLTP